MMKIGEISPRHAAEAACRRGEIQTLRSRSQVGGEPIEMVQYSWTVFSHAAYERPKYFRNVLMIPRKQERMPAPGRCMRRSVSVHTMQMHASLPIKRVCMQWMSTYDEQQLQIATQM